MWRLSEHLKYLIARRIEENAGWRDVQIIFSGADVPGEGEHKIMEYIRLCKAKSDYNPNIRHCLYGLDADLILLGLLSHEPHFALLREEVQFGRAQQQRIKTAAETNFYLLHLCLMREYLELEFRGTVGPKGVISLEGLIDDFILLMCFVGNDFLPNLPEFHLGEGVLDCLFSCYKTALQRNGCVHLNENGTIVFSRLAVVLEELTGFERGRLLIAHPTIDKESTQEGDRRLAQFAIRLYDEFIVCEDFSTWTSDGFALGAQERSWLSKTARLFNYRYRLDSATGRVTMEKDLQATLGVQTEIEKFKEALRAYEGELRNLQLSPKDRLQMAWREWKNQYYESKLKFTLDDGPLMHNLLQAYCEGLQWNMHYYYQGVSSWSWFYPYYYAPHISDLAAFTRDFVCDPFDLSLPLRPLEQLMAVLPPGSVKLVPKALAPLMVEEPTVSFYPKDFETDANGKKASWEAIVKIPFIDTDILLPAIRKRDALLSEEEQRRNCLGSTVTFTFDPLNRTMVPSPSKELPALERCAVHLIDYELPVLKGQEQFRAALCAGVKMGVHVMPGFPTLATLPVTGILESGIGLRIFDQQPTRGFSLVLAIREGGLFGSLATWTLPQIAARLCGRRIYVNWPHLREARVEYVTDGCVNYRRSQPSDDYDDVDDSLTSSKDLPASPSSLPPAVTVEQVGSTGLADYERVAELLEGEYKRRCAVLTGPIPALVFVRPFVGMRMRSDGSLRKEFDPTTLLPYALQTIVLEVMSEDERYVEREAATLQEAFPLHTPLICLGPPEYYGCRGEVSGYDASSDGEEETLRVCVIPRRDSNSSSSSSLPARMIQEAATAKGAWKSSSDMARSLRISPLLLSKLSSSMNLFLGGEMVRAANIGLNLKSDAKGLMALGLVRRTSGPGGGGGGGGYWEYSPVVVRTLERLNTHFPTLLPRLATLVRESAVEAKALFPEVNNREELMKAVAPIQALIREALGGEPVLVPLGEYVPPDVVNSLASLSKPTTATVTVASDQVRKGNSTSSRKDEPAPKEIKLHRSLALTGASAGARLRRHRQSFHLGQRVIITNGSHFGQGGLIIGIEASSAKVRVLLDEPLIGGTTLDGQAPEGRGIIVDSNECLNLNYVQPPAFREGDLAPSSSTLKMDQERASKVEDRKLDHRLDSSQLTGKTMPVSEGTIPLKGSPSSSIVDKLSFAAASGGMNAKQQLQSLQSRQQQTQNKKKKPDPISPATASRGSPTALTSNKIVSAAKSAKSKAGESSLSSLPPSSLSVSATANVTGGMRQISLQDLFAATSLDDNDDGPTSNSGDAVRRKDERPSKKIVSPAKKVISLEATKDGGVPSPLSPQTHILGKGQGNKLVGAKGDATGACALKSIKASRPSTASMGGDAAPTSYLMAGSSGSVVPSAATPPSQKSNPPSMVTKYSTKSKKLLTPSMTWLPERQQQP